MRIIAVSNIKGGVGKTTTAVNLAYLAAASGLSTLPWDLDPQGAATYVLCGEPQDQASARQLVRGKLENADLVASAAYVNLGLVTGDFSDRNRDLNSSERKQRTPRLTPALWREVEEISCRTPH